MCSYILRIVFFVILGLGVSIVWHVLFSIYYFHLLAHVYTVIISHMILVKYNGSKFAPQIGYDDRRRPRLSILHDIYFRTSGNSIISERARRPELA